jgi:hypothetical protein
MGYSFDSISAVLIAVFSIYGKLIFSSLIFLTNLAQASNAIVCYWNI